MTDEVTKKPTLDQVFRDALQLQFTDLEILIKRLTTEREERWEKIRKKFEEGSPLRQRLNYTLAHNIDTDQRMQSQPQEEPK